MSPRDERLTPIRTLEKRRGAALSALGRGVMVLPAAPIQYASRDGARPYHPDRELYYLTGATEPGTVAVLMGGDEPRLVLFVQERDPEAELWSGARLGPEGAAERLRPEQCHPLGELGTRLPELLRAADRVFFRLGRGDQAEKYVLEALAYARGRGARTGVGPRAVVDPGEIIDDMRLVKDEHELALLRRSADITIGGHRAAASVTAPGEGEWAIEAALQASFRAAGAGGSAYEPIVGSGANACVLHYVDNASVVGSDSVVLIDAGAEYGLYNGDVTRTYPAGGRFKGAAREVYEIVEAGRAAGVGEARPGRSMGDVHAAATRVLVEGLVSLGALAGDPDELIASEAHKPFYPHQTSHWLGLDVHDPGDYARAGVSRLLEPGMVLTVEPGLYFRADHAKTPKRLRGLGVRIEDDVAVTAGIVPDALIQRALAQPGPLVAVELRPPRTDVDPAGGMSAWIDLHHSLGRLTRDGLFVFLTDNAVGAAEEENLAHVGANVGDSVDLRRIVPILTTKHTLAYCETFAARAASDGFDALTVLGGDTSVGAPRCVPHGSDLRRILRARVPSLALGGWVNPHRDAREQVRFVSGSEGHAEFALSQVVSHYSIAAVEGLLEAMSRTGMTLPVVFGVFLYRSANPATLATLGRFFPVPAEELTREFASGASADVICARSIRELRAVGADKIYVSNLGSRGAGRKLAKVLELV